MGPEKSDQSPKSPAPNPADGLKDRVGARSGVYRDRISFTRIAAFCSAIGATVRQEAPPTFMTVFRQGEFELFSSLGIPLANVLHTEQVYRFEVPLLAGDELEYQTELTQVLAKKGGALQFLTFETRFTVKRADPSGMPALESSARTLGTACTSVVVRGPSGAGTKAAAGAEP